MRSAHHRREPPIQSRPVNGRRGAQSRDGCVVVLCRQQSGCGTGESSPRQALRGDRPHDGTIRVGGAAGGDERAGATGGTGGPKALRDSRGRFDADRGLRLQTGLGRMAPPGGQAGAAADGLPGRPRGNRRHPGGLGRRPGPVAGTGSTGRYQRVAEGIDSP